VPDVRPRAEQHDEEEAEEPLPLDDDHITENSVKYTVLSAIPITSRIYTRRVIEKFDHVFHPQYLPMISSDTPLGILNELAGMVDDFIVVSRNISKARPGTVLDLTVFSPEVRRIADLKQKPQWLFDTSNDLDAAVAGVKAAKSIAKEAEVRENNTMSYYDDYPHLAAAAEKTEEEGYRPPSLFAAYHKDTELAVESTVSLERPPILFENQFHFTLEMVR